MKTFEMNGIEFALQKTDKYKTLSVYVVFFGEFSKEVATKKSLLARVLNNSTKNYPNKREVSNKLFDLYDASINVSNFPIYKTNLTLFSMSIINSSFVGEASLYDEAFSFLKEFIFNPNIDEGGFTENVFLEEKRILKDQIENMYNNKALYAFQGLLKAMASDEIMSVSSLGTVEDLSTITRKDVFEEYQKTISKEVVKVYVIGDISESDLRGHFASFPFVENKQEFLSSSTLESQVEKVNEVIETQDVNQAQLVMGFRTNVSAMDEDYVPMAVFNMMFGGIVTSDLFRVVREEHSLAYSVYSSIFFDNRLLVVSAGIDKANYELTSDLIIKELERYKQRDISSELLQIAKENLISGLKETDDAPFSYLMFYIKNRLLKGYTVDDIAALVKMVTVDDIYRAAQKIQLDTIFLLRGDLDAAV